MRKPIPKITSLRCICKRKIPRIIVAKALGRPNSVLSCSKCDREFDHAWIVRALAKRIAAIRRKREAE